MPAFRPSRVFPKLRELALENTAVTDAGVEELSHLREIRVLNLRKTDRMTDKAMEYLARMPKLDNLKLLYNRSSAMPASPGWRQ